MIDRTNAKRQEAQRQREKSLGLVRVTVAIPKERVLDLRHFVRKWRTDAGFEAFDASPTHANVEDT